MLYAVFAHLCEDGVHMGAVVIYLYADSVQHLCPTYVLSHSTFRSLGIR